MAADPGPSNDRGIATARPVPAATRTRPSGATTSGASMAA